MGERQGVALDYCPSCRGVWLESGKLDVIAARVAKDDGESAGRSGRTDKKKKSGGLFGDILGGLGG